MRGPCSASSKPTSSFSTPLPSLPPLPAARGLLTHRLKLAYERALLANPTGSYDCGIEKHLWRFGFYVVIDRYRKLHKQAGRGEGAVAMGELTEALFREFLLEASG